MKLGALRLTMWTVRFQSHTFHSRGKLDISFCRAANISENSQGWSGLATAESLAPDKPGFAASHLSLWLTVSSFVTLFILTSQGFAVTFPPRPVIYLIRKLFLGHQVMLIVLNINSWFMILHKLLQNIWSDALLRYDKELEKCLDEKQHLLNQPGARDTINLNLMFLD